MSYRDLARRLRRLAPRPTPGPLAIILVGEYDDDETEEEALCRARAEGQDLSGHVILFVDDDDAMPAPTATDAQPQVQEPAP